MGYPELDRDESIILEAKNVKFKSISFDARLTNRRIILIDSRKNIIPPQEILLATIWGVEAGENAIRDHLLSLTVLNNVGEKEQIVLTFPRLAGAERKRECNDWTKKLRGLIHPSAPGAEPADQTEYESREKQEISPTGRGEVAGRRPVKKRIETARPRGKIVDQAPATPMPPEKTAEQPPLTPRPADKTPAKAPIAPKSPVKIAEQTPVTPVETSSLPSGIFCLRCGNRVPAESTYCNRCGSPMKPPAEKETAPPPAPEVPQVQIPPPPPVGSAAGDRPIEQIIHSIEPLIEDSVPRTQPTPLVKKRSPLIISEQAVSEPEVVISPPEQPASATPAGSAPVVQWPVLPSTDSVLAPIQIPEPDQPSSPPPPVPSTPASKLPGTLSIVLLVIVVLAFIGGLIIAANLAPGQPAPGTPAPTLVKTSLVTTPATATPTTVRTVVTTPTPPPGTTLVPIPPSGVFVRVFYPGTFTGLIGTPGNQFNVNDAGDQVYSISTTDGIVSVFVQKKDGSGDKMTVDVYKDGVLVTSRSTTTPKGTVEIQFNLKSLQSGNVSATPTM